MLWIITLSSEERHCVRRHGLEWTVPSVLRLSNVIKRISLLPLEKELCCDDGEEKRRGAYWKFVRGRELWAESLSGSTLRGRILRKWDVSKTQKLETLRIEQK